MSAESPMMRRMRNIKFSSQSNFPKKGIIRIMLAIGAIVIGMNVCGALFNNGPSIKSKTDKLVKVEKKKLKNDSKNRTQQYLFSIEDVSTILKQKSHQFESNADILAKDGKSYLIHYSIDTTLQKLGSHLMNIYHPKYGAVVAIDPTTGRVLSLISYVNDTVRDLGPDLFCKSLFPAASVFKTITAATAIEKANYSSQSIVKHVGRKSTLYKYQLAKELPSCTELPLEEAFANSINPVFARLAMYVVGENSIEDYAAKFGFNNQVPFELANEPSRVIKTDSTFTLAELASGFNQHTTMSPLLGALIASSISEGGKMPIPSLVDSITLNDSCVYRSQKELWRTPIKENTARELRTMMHCVAKYGTARKSFRDINRTSWFEPFEYGGKTGSVDKDSAGRVDWFIGFARNPSNPKERIAVGAVTVHGAFWTVHSSYIAAEYFRTYISSLRKNEQKKIEQQKILVKKESDGSEQLIQRTAAAHI